MPGSICGTRHGCQPERRLEESRGEHTASRSAAAGRVGCQGNEITSATDSTGEMWAGAGHRPRWARIFSITVGHCVGHAISKALRVRPRNGSLFLAGDALPAGATDEERTELLEVLGGLDCRAHALDEVGQRVQIRTHESDDEIVVVDVQAVAHQSNVLSQILQLTAYGDVPAENPVDACHGQG
jgi:hypothetical protein